MRYFVVFMAALFAMGVTHAETTCGDGQYLNGDACIMCPIGTYNDNPTATTCTPCPEKYPYSEPGAASRSECYARHIRDCRYLCTVPNYCAKSVCNFTQCEYTTWYKAFGAGDFRDGCSAACDGISVISVSASPGSIVNGVTCTRCPAGTYSAGGDATTCTPCPNGAISSAGATGRAECMRILNYLRPGDVGPKKIYLGMAKQTSPALAVQIGDDIFYGNMTPVQTNDTPGLYIRYNNQSYLVQDNKINNEKKYPFYVTTTPDTSMFSFSMTAAGIFSVDWGDGITQEIVRDDTNIATYSHTYDTPGEYKIGFDGRATGYNAKCATGFGANKIYYSAISFSGNANVAVISGALGGIFPMVNGASPGYMRAFYGCDNLAGQIPIGLFGDLSGVPHSCMFQSTFYGCSGLTGPTARTADGTRLYDVEYNGAKWIDAYPNVFTDMYTDSGVNPAD